MSSVGFEMDSRKNLLWMLDGRFKAEFSKVIVKRAKEGFDSSWNTRYPTNKKPKLDLKSLVGDITFKLSNIEESGIKKEEVEKLLSESMKEAMNNTNMIIDEVRDALML